MMMSQQRPGLMDMMAKEGSLAAKPARSNDGPSDSAPAADDAPQKRTMTIDENDDATITLSWTPSGTYKSKRVTAASAEDAGEAVTAFFGGASDADTEAAATGKDDSSESSEAED